jgi:hypothetical protein
MITPTVPETVPAVRIPLIGETVPAFKAHTTQGRIGLQTSDKCNVATPADWQPGEDVIVPPPGSCGTAKQRVEKPDADAYALDWFMTFKMMSKA